ncbi:Transducin/WD40 repeat-like superfamily protein [Abeliophyllum distichum]|uniref:Transducin/WD40 repeat-like superfamily protein n=1 Tax=Abeliophyllum distichum TaxID=126358 RepID=A0ABD1W0M4_9LAMI
MSSSRFQAASLVASPSYPNAVAWSDENLVAVASGNLVSILNPAKPFGPRGLVTINSSKPFPIGVIERQDLLSECLLPVCLSRDTRSCVRSISWSPVGLAPNSGCLLAVCTSEGQVKIYRMPFCEFSAEWVEVMDISEMLHAYLLNINFGEPGIISSEHFEESQLRDTRDLECADDLPISILRNKCKRRRQDALSVAPNEPNNLRENTTYQIVPMSVSKGNPLKKATEKMTCQIVPTSVSKAKPLKKATKDCNVPLITAQQYASRNAMLASLIVAWSPILPMNSSSCCSVLAVGGKCGRISFWRIHGPQSYSLSNNGDTITATPIGFLHAHDTWITAISWALFDSDASNSQFLLATGSSDGSVKIWQVNGEEMLKSSEVSHASFSLLKVMAVDNITVSVLSLIVPVQSPQKMPLAIGKGSGTFEVWICDIPTRKFEKVGCYDAHDHIVMGLAWAFDGRSLYSCSQDNSIRSWCLHENSLYEVPIPSNTPGVKCSTDVPNAFDSCFGLAVSPGNLVIAVVRRFDSDLLNPMYQERTQKAAVEFLWIGGQQFDISSNVCPDFDVEAFPGLPEKELIWWEKSILWSLNHCENLDNPLIVWDIVGALSAFKQSIPKFVEHILHKWLTSCFGSHFGSPTTFLPEASKFLSKLSSRRIHLLNIIIRHVVLKELNADKKGGKEQEIEGLSGAEEEQLFLWMELLSSSERELQERLVGLTFSAILSLLSNPTMESCKVGCWSPIGLVQMEQWVSLNYKYVKDYLKFLAAEVEKLEKRRLNDIYGCEVEEKCSFCSAAVPFESTEFAFCLGVKGSNRVGQSHKLARCAVTMRCCPTTPSWFCTCCQRWASKLAPRDLFIMPGHLSDFDFFAPSSSIGSALPYCPFCGILLQRLQPDFLLSPSPV